MDLVEQIYKLTSQFPRDKQFALSSQMNRAAISIPRNVAEGSLRYHQKEYVRFVYIVLRSAAELEMQLLICRRLPKLKHYGVDPCIVQTAEVKRMPYALAGRLNIPP